MESVQIFGSSIPSPKQAASGRVLNNQRHMFSRQRERISELSPCGNVMQLSDWLNDFDPGLNSPKQVLFPVLFPYGRNSASCSCALGTVGEQFFGNPFSMPGPSEVER